MMIFLIILWILFMKEIIILKKFIVEYKWLFFLLKHNKTFENLFTFLLEMFSLLTKFTCMNNLKEKIHKSSEIFSFFSKMFGVILTFYCFFFNFVFIWAELVSFSFFIFNHSLLFILFFFIHQLNKQYVIQYKLVSYFSIILPYISNTILQ